MLDAVYGTDVKMLMMKKKWCICPLLEISGQTN